MLDPGIGMEIFQKSMCGKVEEFPLVKIGCSAKATDRKKLCTLLEKSFENKLGLENSQKTMFNAALGSNSSTRIVNLILNLTKN